MEGNNLSLLPSVSMVTIILFSLSPEHVFVYLYKMLNLSYYKTTYKTTNQRKLTLS